MKKLFLILAALFITFVICKLNFASAPDEDKLIENLYNKGAMTGYSSAPATTPFWYSSGSPYYGPYYWTNYAPQNKSTYSMEVRPVGRILIIVEPADAQVYVDGKKLQQMPDLTYQAAVFSGAHRVDILKEGFEKFSEEVSVYPASGIMIPIKLNKKGK